MDVVGIYMRIDNGCGRDLYEDVTSHIKPTIGTISLRYCPTNVHYERTIVIL